MGALISNVDKNSPAHKSGVQKSDILISVNGRKISDVLDYKFYAYDTELKLEISRDDQTIFIDIKKSEGQDLGIDFETYLMDTAKSCSNKCIFCFIDQLPKGMRKTLYFKDDDARLSFLIGNYISLTNLSDADVERMIKMKISPINVSVQTTNPEIRNLMLGRKNAGDSLKILEKFANASLTMNCQLVICHEINDGDELTRSLEDLKKYYPSVNSISVVPAGLTKHRENLYDLKPITKENANDIIKRTEDFAKKCLEEFGTSLAFCGDELYIRAEKELPKASYYEGFEQFENGVGMVSLFKEEFIDGMEDFSGKTDSFTIATGGAAYPFLSELVKTLKEKNTQVSGDVVFIENNFFGATVSVAGLITGSDLIAGLRGKELGSKILISENMLRDGGDVFLDDLTIQDIEKELKRPVKTVKIDGYALLEEIYGR